MYFYHPDHLGSSSYITDKNGEVIQHTEYMAFGETFVDEHSVNPTQPYLFNGKELDYETGLYYYGARYYDPKTSLWLNTDPLSGYNPIQEVEHYIDGQHNGGVHNPMNLNTYTYTYQNPIRYIDPNGKQVESGVLLGFGGGTTATTTATGGVTFVGGSVALPLLMIGGIFVVDYKGKELQKKILIQESNRFGRLTIQQQKEELDKESKKVAKKDNLITFKKDNILDKENNKLDFAKKKKEASYGKEAEHTKGARPSTRTKHEEGQARKTKDKGGEKGDARRKRYK